MMYTRTLKQIRSDNSVNFFSFSSLSCMSYYKKNYIETGKITKTETELTEDGLCLISTNYWVSEKDAKDFDNDEIINKELKNPFYKYVEENKIQVISNNNIFLENQILGPEPYKNLIIPDSWENIESFADWYVSNGMPLIIPNDAEVFLSDDATAVCLFKKGRFQVELYLIHPNPKVPVHGHPDVEVIKVRLSGNANTYLSETLRNNSMHGAGMRLQAETHGYPLLAIQHWLTREPTTVASMWRGKTVGPMQEALIKRFNSNAYIKDGYADITKSI